MSIANLRICRICKETSEATRDYSKITSLFIYNCDLPSPIGELEAGIVLFTLKVPESVQAKDLELSLKEKILQMDLLGMVTIVCAVLCYILVLEWEGVTRAWNDESVIGTVVGCTVLLALFGILEWHLVNELFSSVDS
jgi:hypothetical protein